MGTSSLTRTPRGYPALAEVALAAWTAACGSAPTLQERIELQGLRADNGLTANGLSNNGLSQNGLTQNGLTQNGLSQNGFAAWFNLDAVRSDAVMRHIVKCAVASGQSRTWTNPSTGVTYVWPGLLGLAPGWAGGAAATGTEQQVITACLAAHVNKYGIHVPISVLGRTATGGQIPTGPDELATFSVREACFFGNLFSGDGVFFATDHAAWPSAYTTARACSFNSSTGNMDLSCPPLVEADTCKKLCTPDATGTFYESCNWNGKTYKTLTTRLRPQEVFKCSDGVCEFTDSCGTGGSWDNCKADCGVCR